MQNEQHGVNRRTFLKTSLQATAGAVALGAGSGAAQAAISREKKIPLAGNMPEREFGKTGYRLPILGHGGSAMIQQFIQYSGCALLPEEERVAMVRHGYDSGMRYFDTARVYGESERIMGKALKGVRDNVYLASKVLVMTPEAVRPSVEKSLSELDTSYVDCMQIHGPCLERIGVDGGKKILEELSKLRDEGLFRFIGLTNHSEFEMVHELLKTGGFDQVLLARGYFKKGMDQMLSERNLEWRELCIAEAHERNMGIVLMKVFGYFIMGHNAATVVPDFDKEELKKLPAAAIRWALQDERFHILNIGVTIPSDIDTNIEILNGDLAYTTEDRKVLAEFSRKAYENPLVKSFKIV